MHAKTMKLSPSEIIGQVACVTGVPAAAITGPRRTNAVTLARFLCIAAIRKAWPHFSLSELAASVGRSDHGTAIHSLRQFQNLADQDPTFRAQAAELNLL